MKEISSYIFTPELVRASLILALISVSIGIGLFAYFRLTTRRTHYGFWTAAWLLYAIFLAATMGLEEWPQMRPLMMGQLMSIGMCALLLFGGSFELFEVSQFRRFLGPAVLLIAVWSVAAVSVVSHSVFPRTAIFALAGAAGVYTGVFYFRHRKYTQRINIPSMAFILWGVHMVVFGFVGAGPTVKSLAYLSSAVLALGVAVGIVIDHAVEISERKFRAVFDSSGDAIFIVDLMTLKILDVNRSALSLTKRRIFQLIDASFLELCPDLRKDGNGEMNNRKMLNEVFKPYSEFRIVCGSEKDAKACEGEMGLVGWHKRPALQLNVREVGDRKKFGQQFRRSEKLSSLGQLVAGVAHELNNPLAVVLGYAQLLTKQTQLDEKTKGDLRKMLHECERAAKIVRNLLTFVRPAEPQMAAVNINSLINRHLEIREANPNGAKVTILKQLAPELPWTKVDAMQIEQVLSNLIQNAIHAMAKNQRPPVVEISTEVRGTYIRIAVSDNGPGMTQEVVSKIFDPFFTTKGPGKGTGLGLTICHGIVSEHLGKIWLQSEVGVGTRFYVELPIVPCKAMEIEPEQPAMKPAAGQTEAPKHRLLVVDDEPGIREVLKEMLGCYGYAVETAGNGKEAMQQISASDYDLIISDLCMPEMDGPTLYEKVRERDVHLAARMVFVTGDTVSSTARAFLESTGNRWLSKPFNLNDVEATVANMLRQPPALLGGN